MDFCHLRLHCMSSEPMGVIQYPKDQENQEVIGYSNTPSSEKGLKSSRHPSLTNKQKKRGRIQAKML